MITIGVKYSCTACGLKDVEVQVRARESAEDIIAWMRGTCIVTLAEDHMRRSPECHPEELHDVKIPITGVEWVGGPPVQ